MEGTRRDMDYYGARREALRKRFLPAGAEDRAGQEVATSGVDHLALICSDLEATIRFYTEVLRMRLLRVIQNRDEPSSTHIFLDMGGGNMLAFFDFPETDTERTRRGVGSMHHVALKATPENFAAILDALAERGIDHRLHGSRRRGSVYVRDPDGILVEITTVA
jgi:catechol 2,3-dioxygenase-like lactoylglutathione lyase family enzyme